MAFTLATLKTAIQDYTQNDEDTFVNNLDVIIKQAEERINLAIQVANYNTNVKTGILAASSSSVTQDDGDTSPVSPLYFKSRSRDLFTCATTNTSTTVTTASTATIDVGATVDGDGIADGTTVASIGDATTLTLSAAATATDASVELSFSESSNLWQFLLLKDYNFLQEYSPADSTTGTPRYYSFYNDNSNSGVATFPFGPFSDGSYDYEILYLFRPTSLVDVEDDPGTTWLSIHGETALLYGSLVEAYTFMKGEQDLLQLYDTRFKEGLQLLIMSQQGSFRNSTYRDNTSQQMAV
jgi:hypothetical protein